MGKYQIISRIGKDRVNLETIPPGYRERHLYIVKFPSGYETQYSDDGGGGMVGNGNFTLKIDAIDAMIDDLLEYGGTGTIDFVVEGESCQ